jgi:hypothetical protein
MWLIVVSKKFQSEQIEEQLSAYIPLAFVEELLMPTLVKTSTSN